LLFISIKKRTHTAPTKAPREEDEIVPLKAVRGKKRNSIFFHRGQCSFKAIKKQAAKGKKIHICMPNSPEFLNHPGPPPDPMDTKPRPADVQPKKENWAILKLYRRKASMKTKKRFSVLIMLMIKKYTIIQVMNSGIFRNATSGSNANIEERRITKKKRKSNLFNGFFTRGESCRKGKNPKVNINKTCTKGNRSIDGYKV
jgi:hypothetical protein